MTSESTDILIVGSGIAGAALACGIRELGYRVVLVERSPDPPDTARGDHLQPYSVELLERWGVLDDFLKAGAGRRHGVSYKTGQGELIFDAPLGDIDIPHPYYLYLNHDLIGELLLARAADNPGFTLLRPAIARRFEMDGERVNGVEVQLPDKSVTNIRAHLVIGADGRDSRLRASAGIKAESHDYPRPLVVFFGPHPHPEARGELYSFCGENRTTSCIPRMAGQAKVAFTVTPSEIAFWRKADQEQRRQAIAQRVDFFEPFQPELAGFYPTRCVMVEAYARANMALIGDAAHAMSPTRGQGMNVALRGVERLIGCLPPSRSIGSASRLGEALSAYDTQQQQVTRPVEIANHARASQTVAEVVAYLRRVQADAQLKYRYLIETTGYPLPASS